MSVSTETSAIKYNGNNSTATAYAIPFPFLNAGHIFAAVQRTYALGVVESVTPAGTLTDYEVTLFEGMDPEDDGPKVGDIAIDENDNRGTILVVTNNGGGSFTVGISNGDPFAAVATEQMFNRTTNELAPGLGYTVTRLSDGSGGSLKTTVAVPVSRQLIIYRSVPLTQPTVFQPNGPFPAKSNETALDRLLMQVQQLNRRMNDLEGTPDGDYRFVPSGDSSLHDTAIWADTAARGSVKPQFTGQLGVQIDNQTIWIAQSLDAGDWKEFLPAYDDVVVTLGLVADAGNPGTPQNQIGGLLGSWLPTAVLFAGDNNYNGAANYDADWEQFESNYIALAKAFPALGNHDVDEADWEDRHNTKFSYLPTDSGNRRYYRVTFGNGLIDLFVLHSGLNSLGDLVEEDGNTTGSVQHQWFVDELNASKARWKIAMFHHPTVTTSGEPDRVVEAMNWPELQRMDLIVCGHTHMLELLQYGTTMLANPSAAVHIDGDAEGVVQGGLTTIKRALWADDVHYGAARLIATAKKLILEFWRSDTIELLFSTEVRDMRALPKVRFPYRVVPPTVVPDADVPYHVCRLPASMIIDEVLVYAATAPAAVNMEFELNAGIVTIATGTLGLGATRFLYESVGSDNMIPEGTEITFTHNTYPDPGTDAEGVEVVLIGRTYN